MIRAEKLRKVFQPHRGKLVEAVKGASFEVEKGEVFGLLGPNGAGKTTLLRMLATIITPTAGECYIDGQVAGADPQTARRKLGFLSGNTRLYARLTAKETLLYFGRLYDLDEGVLRGRIAELAELLAMEEFMDRRCEALSTGQTQKVSIARVMLHDPPVLILDEPTTGLDVMSSRVILDFILAAKERGRAIIFSTHYMTEAEILCDRVGLIYSGDMLAVGTQEELYAQTGTANLKDAFLTMADQQGVHGP
jgi:sodium transport system ATP-binding protein